MKSGEEDKHDKTQLRAVRIREHRRAGGRSDSTPNVSLQILGSGSRHSPPSVLIIAGTNRLLFNCGEGVQRLLLENGIKTVSRLEHLLFTRLTWDNIGGTIGITIGMKDIGLKKVYFHGPPNLDKFVEAFRTFTKNETLDIVTRSYTEGILQTEGVVITPVPLFSTGHALLDSSSSSSDNDSDPTEGITKKHKGRFEGENPHGMKRRKLDSSNLSLAYVCKLHPKPGKLLMNKCKEAGVNPRCHGVIQDLKQGKSYTTEDGRVVKPEDVLGPTQPAIFFIVLECPSVEYINAVTTSEVLARHQDGHGSDMAKIIIHMCPQQVIENSTYIDWMQSFGTSTEHVILNQSSQCVSHLAVRRLQTKLNLVHDGIFPKLPFAKIHDRKEQTTSNQIDSSLKIHQTETFMMFHLRPDNGWSREYVQSSDVEPFLEEVRELPPEFNNSLADLKKSLETLPDPCDNKYPEVVFTGTGSAIPNKDRNITGILVNVSETQSLLMDCGEGTYGQLYRYYGNQRIDDIIANLECIFVSHIHADHHSGLIKVIQEWKRIMKEQGDNSKNMIVVGPRLMMVWLMKYDSMCEAVMDRVSFVDLKTLSALATVSSPYEKSLLERLDLTKFETVPVLHCYQSHGVVITHCTGWKLAYSGDCMPTETLVKAGQDADLLIHEATLEDGMNEEALDKKHSMISDALGVSARMNAKYTLLTHFSQRYMKIPYFKSEVRGQVGIAFDNMRVSLAELPIVAKFLPVLQHLFADKIIEMTDRQNRKAEKASLKCKQQLPTVE